MPLISGISPLSTDERRAVGFHVRLDVDRRLR
jgi:hypothetical protein